MTLNNFVNKYNNKGIDFESGILGLKPYPPSQPRQCWDLGAFFNYQVVGGGKNFYTGDGCAAGVYHNFTKGPLKKFYKKIANNHADPKQVPQPGDIIVWNYALPNSGKSGHLAICLEAKPGAKTFLSFDQNWGGAYCHKVVHAWSYGYVDGWLRPLKNVVSVPIAPVYYTIQKGDWLIKIAGKFKLSLAKILKLNPKIKNPNLIYQGQKIRVK